jgi:hypothetical protein
MAIESKLPYLNAYGNIGKALEKIKVAGLPSDRFSQDFLEKTLGMTGGGSRPVLPFLKRTGFLSADGTPTDLYKEFRNPERSGGAAAKALRIGYARLFEMDEKVYKRDAETIKNLIVQATGVDADAPSVRATVKSFEALNAFAKFSQVSFEEEQGKEEQSGDGGVDSDEPVGGRVAGLNLGYTINLNLPSTSDVGVYNAIFKSLKENLLRDLG